MYFILCCHAALSAAELSDVLIKLCILYLLFVGPEWAAVNMAITLCHHCAGSFVIISLCLSIILYCCKALKWVLSTVKFVKEIPMSHFHSRRSGC